MISRLAAGAAALVLGAALATAAVPASAAPAAATRHTVTYSPGALPVLGALGITIVPGVSPTISAPDGGAVHTGDTIVFKTTGSAATVKSTTPNWSFSLPVSGAKPASVTVPAKPGTYGYGVGNAKKAFQATSASSGGSTQPPPASSGGGPVLGLTGGQKQPPPAGSGGGGAPADGSGAAGSGAGSGAAGSTGSGAGSGSFDSSRFGNGSGDFPNLPGGVLAAEAPQAGSIAGGPPPEIATYPTAGASDGAFGEPSPAPGADGSSDTVTNAAQVVGPSSSVSGPAAAAAALLALVVIGLARAWVTHRPLRRH